jgi:uncharacterized protein CbrC (UPF0167 family)
VELLEGLGRWRGRLRGSYRRVVASPSRLVIRVGADGGQVRRELRLYYWKGGLFSEPGAGVPSGPHKTLALPVHPGELGTVRCLPDPAAPDWARELELVCVYGEGRGYVGRLTAEERDNGAVLTAHRRAGSRWVPDFQAELSFTVLPAEAPAPLPAAIALPPLADASSLPSFRYHPDPLRTGALVPDTRACGVCGKARAWRYTGPIWTRDEAVMEAQEAEELVICPWCLHEGRAAREFEATFNLCQPLHERRVRPPDHVVEEVELRTPGFPVTYHPFRAFWFVHHNDACVYLATVGPDEYPRLEPEEQAAVRASGYGYLWSERALRRMGPSTAAGDLAPLHLFRCRHCPRYFTSL